MPPEDALKAGAKEAKNTEEAWLATIRTCTWTAVFSVAGTEVSGTLTSSLGWINRSMVHAGHNLLADNKQLPTSRV